MSNPHGPQLQAAVASSSAAPVVPAHGASTATHEQTQLVEGHDHNAHGPAHLHHHFDDMEQQREATNLGIWSFMSTEVMMFGGLFFVYALYRYAYHDAYVAGSKMLNIGWGTANTFVLLASSFTMVMAVYASQTNKKQMMIWSLVATWILGAAFLGVKAFEWTADYNEGLVPALSWHPMETLEHKASSLAMAGLTPERINTDHMQMYFVIYFCMTGLHAIHMIIGLGIVAGLIRMAQKDKFSGGNDQPVELVGIYWHFVDIVWIFLFPLLYLIGGFHLFTPGGH